MEARPEKTLYTYGTHNLDNCHSHYSNVYRWTVSRQFLPLDSIS